MGDSPRLSVIICIYNMAREAPRTILSAALPYQQDVRSDDFQVIVVDNGSTQPLAEADKERRPLGATLVSMPKPQPSPVFALNWAAREFARGDNLLFAIDGARIFSDRLYADVLAVHELIEDAFVYTLGWHLGPKVQSTSTREGYDAAAEDRLIAASGWPERRRALFDISVLGGTGRKGAFQPIAGSNAFSVPRSLYDRLGGFDERFVSPGGGLANHELFNRYVTRPNAANVCLLSEGTFHQVHGGVATSRQAPEGLFRAEYKALMGEEHRRPDYKSLYYAGEGLEFRRFIRVGPEKRENVSGRMKTRIRALFRRLAPRRLLRDAPSPRR